MQPTSIFQELRQYKTFKNFTTFKRVMTFVRNFPWKLYDKSYMTELINKALSTLYSNSTRLIMIHKI